MARRTAQALIVLTVALAATACGGGDDEDQGVSPDDAPRDATPADFCAAWSGQDDVDPGEGASVEEAAAAAVETYRRDAAALQETGTPADIPDDARDGFETLVEATGELTEAMVVESLEAQDLDLLAPVLEGDDATSVEVYTDWADEYCA